MKVIDDNLQMTINQAPLPAIKKKPLSCWRVRDCYMQMLLMKHCNYILPLQFTSFNVCFTRKIQPEQNDREQASNIPQHLSVTH